MLVALATRHLAVDHLPELGGGRIGGHLLDFAFDTALRFVFDDYPGAFDDVAVQFGLARAVATHGVEVHAGYDHIRGEDGGVGLVGGHRGDDIGPAHRIGHGAGDAQLEAGAVGQVGDQFGRSGRVDVIQADFIDAQQGIEGDGLELALRAIADQRHAAAVFSRQVAGGQGRGGCGADGGGQGHFAEQQRCTGIDARQGAEGHHRGQAMASVLRMAVDVLEGVAAGVRDWHQLDHAIR
ncbi:hypothetical protein D9M73_172670 [compost metagenome]